MTIEVEEKPRCQDYGRPGCKETPDPKYDMDFSDIGEGKIQFCSACGPLAHSINAYITDACRTGGKEFLTKFEALIVGAENKVKAKN